MNQVEQMLQHLLEALLLFTYAGLLKGQGGGSFAQGVDCGHVDFVGVGGEDLREADVTAVLVVGILLHLQRVLVVSVDESEGWTSAPNPHSYLRCGAQIRKHLHSQIGVKDGAGFEVQPGKAEDQQSVPELTHLQLNHVGGQKSTKSQTQHVG